MVLNDISTRLTVGVFWVPGHSGEQGNEFTDKLTRDDTVHQFVGPEPDLGVSRQNMRKIKYWINNEHMVMWQGLVSTQRQPRKLILGPGPTAKTRLLSFSRTQSMAVTCLLTGDNTLRKHLYLMGLIGSPLM
jgi:hypothetical protein